MQQRKNEWGIWKAITKSRRIKDIKCLPIKVQKELVVIKQIIREVDPSAQIFLKGSWIKGTWIDKETPNWLKILRKKFTGKNTKSDIDIYVVSNKGEYLLKKRELIRIVDVTVGKKPAKKYLAI